ncbi:hypothetical protein [Thiohalorhabdus methylotrophus]|uniref:AP2 domain-containing protein n=1 Tax=Thiohalorhabdus methylotrophus TaxID=3242694 RepID=A0ABV4TSA6_9GAMM
MYINGTRAGKIQKEREGWSAFCRKSRAYVKEKDRKFYGKDFSEAAQAFCQYCEEP